MGTLDLSDLFTPAPSGVGAAPVTVPSPSQTNSTWMQILVKIAQTVQLPVTSWPSGGVAATMLGIMAVALAKQDLLVSTMIQGGFLDFAAFGTVTDPDTGAVIYVTPDPTKPGTWNGATTWPGPGWLDILADSFYDVQRGGATSARVSMSFTNAGATTDTYPPGTFHVAVTSGPAQGKTFSNVNALAIPGGSSSGYAFQADAPGRLSIGSGAITTLVTSVVNVTCTNPAPPSDPGADNESNASLVNRCRAKPMSLSVAGPAGAYVYWATNAGLVLAQQTMQPSGGSPALTSPITSASAGPDIYNGDVICLVSQATGYEPYMSGASATIVAGAANLAVLGATNTSPIVLSVSDASKVTNGMLVQVDGVEGNIAANGFWAVAGVDVGAGTFQLVGSTGSGTYTQGGVVEAGDLGLVDWVLNQKVVPESDTLVTRSARSFVVCVAATIYVPFSTLTQYGGQTQFLQQVGESLSTAFASIPMGGFVQGVPVPNSIPLNFIEAAIFAADPTIRDVSMSLTTTASSSAPATTDIVLISDQQPIVAYGSFTAGLTADLTQATSVRVVAF